MTVLIRKKRLCRDSWRGWRRRRGISSPWSPAHLERGLLFRCDWKEPLPFRLLQKQSQAKPCLTKHPFCHHSPFLRSGSCLRGYSLRSWEPAIPIRITMEMRETYISNSNSATGFRWAVWGIISIMLSIMLPPGYTGEQFQGQMMILTGVGRCLLQFHTKGGSVWNRSPRNNGFRSTDAGQDFNGEAQFLRIGWNFKG